VDGYPRYFSGEIRDRSLIIHRGGQEEITGNLNNAKKNVPSPTFPLISRYISEGSVHAMLGVTSRAISQRRIHTSGLQTSGTVMHSVQEQGTL